MHDIVESCHAIAGYTGGRTLADFKTDAIEIEKLWKIIIQHVAPLRAALAKHPILKT
jgi:crotonobetainyl-CoA:carnitine CoA-transferase CaiB-like acyl-CoA transferase